MTCWELRQPRSMARACIVQVHHESKPGAVCHPELPLVGLQREMAAEKAQPETGGRGLDHLMLRDSPHRHPPRVIHGGRVAAPGRVPEGRVTETATKQPSWGWTKRFKMAESQLAGFIGGLQIANCH